ncbi:MAG TPA: Na+/H+ antiporter subunit E [Acidimicrobiales bacterium]|nr:Na+/H+ antiporter subunit E [Acidimicrobiales bacterium]
MLRARALPWMAWWALSLGLWLVLSDRLTTPELLTGGAAAALAATLAEVVRAQVDRPLAFRLGWLRPALAIPGQVAHDTWRAGVVLARTVAGRPPESGVAEVAIAEGSPVLTDETALALLVAGRSAPPGSIVVEADADRRVLVVHRLELR